MEEPQKPIKQSKQPRKQPSQQAKTIYYIIIAVCVVVGGLIIIGSHGSGSRYSAKTTGVVAQDSSTVSVSFQVTNNGQTSGQPWCNIDVEDPSGGSGADRVELSSIAPGQTTTSADTITVSNQDAQQATQANISCN